MYVFRGAPFDGPDVLTIRISNTNPSYRLPSLLREPTLRDPRKVPGFQRQHHTGLVGCLRAHRHVSYRCHCYRSLRVREEVTQDSRGYREMADVMSPESPHTPDGRRSTHPRSRFLQPPYTGLRPMRSLTGLNANAARSPNRFRQVARGLGVTPLTTNLPSSTHHAQPVRQGGAPITRLPHAHPTHRVSPLIPAAARAQSAGGFVSSTSG